jgi:hypothetical protein
MKRRYHERAPGAADEEHRRMMGALVSPSPPRVQCAAMALYLAESYEWQVLHDGRMSQGVVGEGGSSERIYLHVIEVSDADAARLGPRVDENGNRESDRLALPRNEEWWIAVEGDKVWPKTVRPKLTSRCAIDASGAPKPQPLSEAERDVLRKLKAPLP